MFTLRAQWVLTVCASVKFKLMNVQKPACFKLTKPQQPSPSGHVESASLAPVWFLCAHDWKFTSGFFWSLLILLHFFSPRLEQRILIGGRCGVYLSLCSLSCSPPTDWLDEKVTGGEEASLSCKWASDRFRGIMTALCFFSQLFFPESMISDSADVNKGMTSSELIKVNRPAMRSSFTTARSVSSELNEV